MILPVNSLSFNSQKISKKAQKFAASAAAPDEKQKQTKRHNITFLLAGLGALGLIDFLVTKHFDNKAQKKLEEEFSKIDKEINEAFKPLRDFEFPILEPIEGVLKDAPKNTIKK